MERTIYVLLLAGIFFCGFVLGEDEGNDCPQAQKVLDMLIGDNGILPKLLKPEDQSSKNNAVDTQLNNNLLNIIRANGDLLQSLLQNNETVKNALKNSVGYTFPDNLDETSQTGQSGPCPSNENILLFGLLSRLGLLDAVMPSQSTMNDEMPTNGFDYIYNQNGGSNLFINNFPGSPKNLLGNTMVRQGLVHGLFGGNLLNSIVQDDSLLGCLLNRFRGGLQQNQGFLSNLLGGHGIFASWFSNNDDKGPQKQSQENNVEQLNTAEKLLLLQMIKKLEGQKQQDSSNQQQMSVQSSKDAEYLEKLFQYLSEKFSASNNPPANSGGCTGNANDRPLTDTEKAELLNLLRRLLINQCTQKQQSPNQTPEYEIIAKYINEMFIQLKVRNKGTGQEFNLTN